MPDISIVDTKNIIRAVKDKYQTDLSCFSLTPLRYKFDNLIHSHQFNNSDRLIERILNEDSFYEKFLHQLFNTQVELFRDPELWIYLNETVFHQLNGLFSQFDILIPSCSSGMELLSLLILLEENGLRDKSNVYISSISKFTIAEIFKAEIVFKKDDINFENLKKVFPEVDLKKYFKITTDSLIVKKDLFSGVYDIQQGLDFQIDNEVFNFIFFRNILLNFSIAHQNKVIHKLLSGLDKNGMIVFGYRENISFYNSISDKFIAINKTENIFKKK